MRHAHRKEEYKMEYPKTIMKQNFKYIQNEEILCFYIFDI